MRFIHLYWLWCIPILATAAFGLWRISRLTAAKRLRGFGPPDRIARLLLSLNPKARLWKFLLFSAALALLAVVAARPMTGPKSSSAENTGAEFFLVLDVSKSMLTRDVEPYRLEAVKKSLMEWLRHRHGDRIGLILVAGDAFVQAPLTNDYSALGEVLSQISPASMSRGGTNLQGAIEMAVSALKKADVKSRAIVLISDGENLEGDATKAALAAHTEEKTAIFTVGVGTSDGGPVPQFFKNQDPNLPPRDFVKDEYGTRVRSRLDERTLRAIASAGGGKYFRFSPTGNTWETLYKQSLQPFSRKMGASDISDSTDLFQIPLLIAIALLLWEMAISSRLKNPPPIRSAVILPPPPKSPPASEMKTTLPSASPRVPVPTTTSPRSASSAVRILLAFFLLAPMAHAANILSVTDAEKLVKEGRAEEAAKLLRAASQENPDDDYSLFNYGVASYAMGHFDEAIDAFTQVSSSKNEKIRALALTHLGNAQYRLGQSLSKTGNMEGASVSWERAVDFYESSVAERKDKVAVHNLGVAKVELEKALMELGAHLEEAAGKKPDAATRASVYERALEKYEKVTALNAENKTASAKVEQLRGLLSENLREQARKLREQAKSLGDDKNKQPAKENLNMQANQLYEKASSLAPDDESLTKEYAAFRQEVAADFVAAAESKLEEANKTGEKEKAREADLLREQNLLTQAADQAQKALSFDTGNTRANDVLTKAMNALEKNAVAKADLHQQNGDAKASQPNPSAEGAANQYQAALQNYQKALEVNGENAHARDQAAQTQNKLAEQLAKVSAEEMKKAADAAANTPTPKSGDLQKQIGHLEKSAQAAAQSDMLAPGKNNAAALANEASAKLSALRGELDKALAQEGKGSPQNGNEAGKDGDQGKPGKPGSPSSFAQFAQGLPVLTFSEIATGSGERVGQFVDKTKKQPYRDW